MRNLKRALSLALASVMLLGMMVVGSSAKGLDDFSDAAEITNKDAVAIITELGIMEGYDNDEFGGSDIVTRAQAAVIVAKMLYGADVKVAQFAENNAFTDLQDWNAGYVNLVASLGIVAGYGDGKYGPNDQLTTAQFASILAKTLGWFQNEADYGDNWALAATAKGTEIGLYEGLDVSANAGLTRENVATMVFNALTKAIPVQYNTLLGVYYNENQGVTAPLTFDYLETLGYNNFDLVYRSNETTDYGRPATTWGTGVYKSDDLNDDGSLIPDQVKMSSDDEVITIAETPDYVYTSTQKNKNVRSTIGKSIVDDTDDVTWSTYIDGALIEDAARPDSTNTDWAPYTAKGATTEIYVDKMNDEVVVVVINEYLAEVSKVDDDDDGEYAVVKSLGNLVVDDRKIYTDADLAKGDYVIVTVDHEDHDADEDNFVASIALADVVEGTVARVRKGEDGSDYNGNYIKLDDDSKYEYSKWNVYDLNDINEEHPALDTEYALYLDSNGYVVGFKALEDFYSNYLYVTLADWELGDAAAKVVFSDGTSAKITVDELDGEDIDEDAADELVGKAFAWTEDEGVYNLRSIMPMGGDREDTAYFQGVQAYLNYKDIQEDFADGDGEIYNDAAYITVGGVDYIVDEDTAFIDVDDKVLYTGFEAVPDYINASFVAIDTTEDGIFEVIFIYDGEAQGSDDTYFYVTDADDFETYNKSKNYREHTVYVDGVKGTMIFTQGVSNEINSNGDGVLYQVEKTNSAGVVTDITAIDVVDAPKTVGTRSFYLDVEGVKAPVQYTINSDTVIIVVEIDDDGDYTVYEGALSDMKEDEEDYTVAVKVLETSNSGKVADLIYIVKEEL